MTEYVLDSSAVLAYLHGEPGGDVVAGLMNQACMSVVNIAEVVSKLIENGMAPDDAVVFVTEQPFARVEADTTAAFAAARLRASTRHLGLSLGDRFCLALAAARGAPVLTADRRWKDADLPLDIRLIR